MLRVALIGRPLRRRHSAVMHNAAFDHFGIEARYELAELDEVEVASFVEEAKGPDWLGLQVTAPYKPLVMELCSVVEPEARRIGAVNSVAREGRSLIGFNTDVIGFRRTVAEDLGLDLTGARVVVAGAGGAARAVVAACVDGEAADVVVGNRDPARARRLAASMGPVEGVGIASSDFLRSLATADLAVNATTVGMIDPGVPFPVDLLPATAAVVDLVYVPAETELLRQAQSRGIAAVNGAGMLVAQAEAAFRRWTGRDGAAPVMRRALEPLLEEAA